MKQYVCDWCGDVHDKRENVANVDITVGATNEQCHACVECVPDFIRQHFPDDAPGA